MNSSARRRLEFGDILTLDVQHSWLVAVIEQVVPELSDEGLSLIARTAAQELNRRAARQALREADADVSTLQRALGGLRALPEAPPDPGP